MAKKRPGMFGKEEYTDEEFNEDKWENDSDDDDHGGHMMPLPHWEIVQEMTENKLLIGFVAIV